MGIVLKITIYLYTSTYSFFLAIFGNLVSTRRNRVSEWVLANAGNSWLRKGGRKGLVKV